MGAPQGLAQQPMEPPRGGSSVASSSRLQRPASLPGLKRPGDQTLAAVNTRAEPNRSVDSVLLHQGQPQYKLEAVRNRSQTSSRSGASDRKIMGRSDMRPPASQSISAECMRAAPNRSVDSILRKEDMAAIFGD